MAVQWPLGVIALFLNKDLLNPDFARKILAWQHYGEMRRSRGTTVNSAPRDTVTYSTSFIDDNGRVLLTTSENPAIFELGKTLLSYVRVKVADYAGKAAWVQPVFVKQGVTWCCYRSLHMLRLRHE